MSEASRQEGLSLSVKQWLDKVAALSGLVVASPVIAGCAALLWATQGRPVLFIQERPGKNGSPFRLVKFRTMKDARNERGALRPDSDRLTGMGRFMRSTSLDELPQLWNVLRGELSLVGPRPLLMQYLPRYSPRQSLRHAVLPGITGWAQIHGRNAISWEEKFELDLWYVEHWSLGLDVKILLLTVLRVLQRAGVTSQGHATMPEFMGPSGAPGEERR